MLLYLLLITIIEVEASAVPLETSPSDVANHEEPPHKVTNPPLSSGKDRWRSSSAELDRKRNKKRIKRGAQPVTRSKLGKKLSSAEQGLLDLRRNKLRRGRGVKPVTRSILKRKKIEEGMRVIITGLENNQLLNEKTGKIVCSAITKNAYRVKMEESGKTHTIRSQHLTPINSDDSVTKPKLKKRVSFSNILETNLGDRPINYFKENLTPEGSNWTKEELEKKGYDLEKCGYGPKKEYAKVLTKMGVKLCDLMTISVPQAVFKKNGFAIIVKPSSEIPRKRTDTRTRQQVKEDEKNTKSQKGDTVKIIGIDQKYIGYETLTGKKVGTSPCNLKPIGYRHVQDFLEMGYSSKEIAEAFAYLYNLKWESGPLIGKPKYTMLQLQTMGLTPDILNAIKPKAPATSLQRRPGTVAARRRVRRRPARQPRPATEPVKYSHEWFAEKIPWSLHDGYSQFNVAKLQETLVHQKKILGIKIFNNRVGYAYAILKSRSKKYTANQYQMMGFGAHHIKFGLAYLNKQAKEQGSTKRYS